MSMFRIRAVLALGFFAVSTSASAVTITVTSGADLVGPAPGFSDTSPNTTLEGQILGGTDNPPPSGDDPANGTPGVCTLREAILSANGDIALTADECASRAYCPFRYSPAQVPTPLTLQRIPGECAAGAAGQADVIEFASSTRSPALIQLDYTLPRITDALTIRGLGPDQTIISGSAIDSARFLAFLNPPIASGSARNNIDLPIFQVHPNLPSGAEVKLQDLQVRGTRVHYFGAGATGRAVESDKKVINFSGLVMDNAQSAERKKVSLVNTRFSCNRRGRANALGGRPTAGQRQFFGAGPEDLLFDTVDRQDEAATPTVNFTPSGGAISVQGFAELLVETSTFGNNMADLGSGGGIFGGARDNASPVVTIDNSRFDDDDGRQCLDVVVATRTGQNNHEVCPNAAADSACPAATTAYDGYGRGNYAGAGFEASNGQNGGVNGAPDTLPATPGALPNIVLPNGGAVAVNALNTTVGNIGSVVVRNNTQFLRNQAVGSGGAVHFANVARSTPALPAFSLNDVLFGDNRAGEDGGGVAVLGSTVAATTANFSFVSFGSNASRNRGGALYYVTRPGRPIDFTLENVRFAGNTASDDGGAIYAEDNGSDDSGILNINKASFESNVSDGNGGAVFCGATKDGSQLTNLTFSGNAADNGGGIHVGPRCHLDVNSSTITNNLARFTPATSTRTFVPAVLDDPATTTVNEATPAAVIYQNRGRGLNGGGGIFVPASSLNARVDVRNTIISGNRAMDFQELSPPTEPVPPIAADSDGENGADCSAADNAVLRSAALSDPVNRGFNFVGSARGCGAPSTSFRPFVARRVSTTDDTCQIAPRRTDSADSGDWVGAFVDTGAICESSANPAALDARLRILQDNGGPDILGAHNLTHIPEVAIPVSVTVDGGQPFGCVDGLGAPIQEDEREAPRGTLQAGPCDIGAVEAGSLAPNSANVSVVSLQLSDDDLDVQLSASGTTESEILRVRVDAPAEVAVVLSSLNVRGEFPAAGTAGSYDSVQGVRIYEVDEFGNRSLRYTSGAARPDFRIGVAFAAPLSPSIQLDANESVTLAVTYVYGTSSQLAMETGMTMLALGGLGALPLLVGLVGVRRRRLMLAAIVTVALAGALSSCDSDDPAGSGGNGGGGGIDPDARTFRAGLTRIDYLAGPTSQSKLQLISVQGSTVLVRK